MNEFFLKNTKIFVVFLIFVFNSRYEHVYFTNRQNYFLNFLLNLE